MTITIHSQTAAQAAYACVSQRIGYSKRKEYLSFARSFPTLIHDCGLAQAASFAAGKREESHLRNQTEKQAVLEDVTSVVRSLAGAPAENETLDFVARQYSVADYMRMTRISLSAAAWIKRYAEALLKDDGQPQGDQS